MHESLLLVGSAAAIDSQIAMQVESALGPALQAAYTVMQDYGGKMLVFQNAVPSLGIVFILSLVLTRLLEQVEGLGAL